MRTEEALGFEAELEGLLNVLPAPMQEAVRALPGVDLLEVVLDLGRPPEARLAKGAVTLSSEPVRQTAIDFVLERVGQPGNDNRAGIERTLHRISAIRNRRGQIIGLTLRVGRAIYGTIDILRDLVETGLNLLLLGRPGVGKTTKLREVARVLADDLRKRVMVVDTSNEIGGDGDVPHPGIGGARRMQVSHPDQQHAVMIEAVENHMPEAIIIDEIGTEAEAAAARTIAERGVQLVGTAHGNTLENLVLNPTLSDLVGGVHTVTLGDEEARRRGTQKTVNERRAPPTFDIVVEIVDRDEVIVHRDTAGAVDRLLAGHNVGGERRKRRDGKTEIEPIAAAAAALPTGSPFAAAAAAGGIGGGGGSGRFATAAEAPERARAPLEGPMRIHAHALSRELLQRVMRELAVDARLVDRPETADLILALRSRVDDPRIRRAAMRTSAPVHAVKRNSSADMRRVLRAALYLSGGMDEESVREAVHEAEHAIQRVLAEGVAVPLAPRPPALRKLQHRLVTRYHLDATSMGTEPARHLVIIPPGTARLALEPESDRSN